MGMRIKHRPGWYALRAGMAAVLALGTAGLVAASSAAASPAASGGPHCNASIVRDNFGMANSGPYGGNQVVRRYTITNRHCMQVRIMTYGATVQSIRVPDRHGNLKNVALGFRTLQEYVDLDSPPPTSPNFGGPYFGETIGRYANRIANASFKLQGNTYTLPVNNGPNTLHGGFVGWGNRVWQHTHHVHRLPGPGHDAHHLHTRQRQPPLDPLPGAQRRRAPGDGYQPDQPHLLQPGRGGVRAGIRPEGTHKLEGFHAD